MQQRPASLHITGLRVCDSKGRAIGTLTRIHLGEGVLSTHGPGRMKRAKPALGGRESYIEVATGRGRATRYLLVPVNHIARVTDDAVLLDTERHRVHRLGLPRLARSQNGS